MSSNNSQVPNPPYTPSWSAGPDHGWGQRPRRRRVWPVFAVILAVLVGACFIGMIALGGKAAHDATSTATIEPPASSGGVRKAPAQLTAGDHLDVRAGTYTTTAPKDGLGCTWQRVKAMDGELSSVIAGDIVPAGTDGVMVVKSADAGVSLSGGCVWRRK